MNFGKTKLPTALPPLDVETRRPLSHRFAAASEEVERLEKELAEALEYGRQQEARAQVAENLLVEAKKIFADEVERIKGELSHCLNERDRYLHDYSDINARLKAVASMLLEPLRNEPPPPVDTKIDNIEGLKAIEAELEKTP